MSSGELKLSNQIHPTPNTDFPRNRVSTTTGVGAPQLRAPALPPQKKKEEKVHKEARIPSWAMMSEPAAIPSWTSKARLRDGGLSLGTAYGPMTGLLGGICPQPLGPHAFSQRPSDAPLRGVGRTHPGGRKQKPRRPEGIDGAGK